MGLIGGMDVMWSQFEALLVAAPGRPAGSLHHQQGGGQNRGARFFGHAVGPMRVGSFGTRGSGRAVCSRV